jgi:hypothetical protein
MKEPLIKQEWIDNAIRERARHKLLTVSDKAPATYRSGANRSH